MEPGSMSFVFTIFFVATACMLVFVGGLVTYFSRK